MQQGLGARAPRGLGVRAWGRGLPGLGAQANGWETAETAAAEGAWKEELGGQVCNPLEPKPKILFAQAPEDDQEAKSQWGTFFDVRFGLWLRF